MPPDYNLAVTERKLHSACGVSLRALQRGEASMPIEGEAEEMWREECALRLRAVIVVKELRTGEAAEKLGISESRLSNWVNNIAAPTAYYYHIFSRVFGVSADYLLSGDVNSLDENLRIPLAKGPRHAIKLRRPDLLKEPVVS
jgi:transcriptional regulator with XRE-family HTH domain